MPARRGSRSRRRVGSLVAAAVALLVVSLVVLWLRQPAARREPAPTTAAAAAEATQPTPLGDDRTGRRDAVAAALMLPVPPLEDQPRTAAVAPVPVLAVPPPTTVGPAGVPSGFPRTPAGAVAQLAAIETTVFNTMFLPHTASVHQAWVLPGSPETDQWRLTGHVQTFLAVAGMGRELDATATVTAAPAAGLIKGGDGPDWVVACVLLEVRATISVEARIGFGHCERLQWQPDPHPASSRDDRSPGGRWLIGPGTPPAVAPSTWPGSDLSRLAGWRTWTETLLDGQAKPDGQGR